MTLEITDQFGKKVEVYHGANCVGLHGTVVLTPDEARQLADILYEQAAFAESESKVAYDSQAQT